MKITGNEPANPIVNSEGVISSIGFIDSSQLRFKDARGLTIRQHFAAIAMQGYIASFTGDNIGKSDDVAKRSVEYADALISRLNEKPNPNE